MGFEPGHPKYGGRKKGSTKERHRIRQIVEQRIGKSIPELLLELSTKGSLPDYIETLKALMPYCYPRLNSNGTEDAEVQLSDTEHQELLAEQAKQILELVKMP